MVSQQILPCIVNKRTPTRTKLPHEREFMLSFCKIITSESIYIFFFFLHGDPCSGNFRESHFANNSITSVKAKIGLVRLRYVFHEV